MLDMLGVVSKRHNAERCKVGQFAPGSTRWRVQLGIIELRYETRADEVNETWYTT